MATVLIKSNTYSYIMLNMYVLKPKQDEWVSVDLSILLVNEIKSLITLRQQNKTIMSDGDYQTVVELLNNVSGSTGGGSGTTDPSSVTKYTIGLGNVDNTSDTNKPISTKTKEALDLKSNKNEVSILFAGTTEEFNKLKTTDTNLLKLINDLEKNTNDKVVVLEGKNSTLNTEVSLLDTNIKPRVKKLEDDSVLTNTSISNLSTSVDNKLKAMDEKIDAIDTSGSSTPGDGTSYTLPVSTSTRLGGVKVGDGLSITTEGILSADTQTINIFDGNSEGLVPAKVGSTTTKFLREDGSWVVPTDTNTTYSAITKEEAESGTATTGRTITAKVLKDTIIYYSPVATGDYTLPKATVDLLGGIKVGEGLSISDDGSLSANTQDIPVFTGSVKGLVPPKVGETSTKFLREDGSWVIPTNTTYTNMSSAEGTDGSATIGRLITPIVLKEAIITHSASPKLFTEGVAGIVPAREGTTTTKFLREDGSWIVPTNTTYAAMDQAELTAGTSTTARLITPVRLKEGVELYAPKTNTITGNAGTATKWETARTITIGNKGNTVDGSANASWTLAEIGAAPVTHTHEYLPLAGGTLSGDLNVNGAITATGNVTAYSDTRIKTNIKTITNATNKVVNLNGVTFTRTDLQDKEREYVGLIAQDVQKILPQAVFEQGDLLSVDYMGLVGLLVESIKDLNKRIEVLEGK